MKNLTIITGALLLLFISITTSAQVTYLDVNEKVDKYPQVEWLQGTPVNSFQKDRIYVVELWATWCVPCINAMPHISALHTKFKEHVTFIGQNVWEGDLDKVKKFMADNPKIMNYTVAYAGSKEVSDFDKNWLKPSGTVAIPRTFIIQNNIIVWITQPNLLYEEHLQLLIAGKFTEAAAKEIIQKHKG